MTKFENLIHCQELLKAYHKQLEVMEELNNSIDRMNVAVPGESVKASGINDKVSAYLIRKEKEEDKLNSILCDLIECRQNALKDIYHLDGRTQTILIDKYIRCLQVKDIASYHGLNERTIYRILKESREELTHDRN